jgi:hypothetical protein
MGFGLPITDLRVFDLGKDLKLHPAHNVISGSDYSE